VFEDDYTLRNKAHCHYLMGLAALGSGDAAKSRRDFEKARGIEPFHQMSHIYLL